MQLKALDIISHPFVWLSLVGPYIVGFAFGMQNTYDLLTWQFWYMVWVFLIPGTLLLKTLAKLPDKWSALKNIHTGMGDNHDISKVYIRHLGIVILCLLFVIPLFLFLHLKAQILVGLFIIVTIGAFVPPLRFKYRPFLEAISAILYALPAFIGYTQLTDHYPPVWIIAATWAWIAALQIFPTASESPENLQTGKSTTASIVGFDTTVLFCALLWAYALLTGFLYNTVFVVLGIYPILALLVQHKYAQVSDIRLKLPYINVLIGIGLFWFAVLHV